MYKKVSNKREKRYKFIQGSTQTCIKKDQVKQYSEAKFIQAVREPNTLLKRETYNKTDVTRWNTLEL